MSFCTQCGTKLEEDTEFCTECGQAILPEALDEACELDAPLEKPETLDESDEAFGDVLPAEPGAPSPKRQPSKAQLAGALAAACVVAAGIGIGVGIITNPLDVSTAATNAAQKQIASKEGVEAGDKKQGNEASKDKEDKATVDATKAPHTPKPIQLGRATGNPQSSAQVAEIMAMDPASTSDYVTSQGFTQNTTYPQNNPSSQSPSTTPSQPEQPQKPPASWTPSGDDFFNSLDEDNSLFNPKGDDPSLTKDAPTLTFFVLATDPTDTENLIEPMTTEDLEAGKKPDLISFENVPLKWLAENDMSHLQTVCNLGEQSEFCEEKRDIAQPADAAKVNGQVFGGVTESDDEADTLWCVSQNQTTLADGKRVQASDLNCVSLEYAEKFTLSTKLYTKAEWDKADAKTRTSMFTKSVAQHDIDELAKAYPSTTEQNEQLASASKSEKDNEKTEEEGDKDNNKIAPAEKDAAQTDAKKQDEAKNSDEADAQEKTATAPAEAGATAPKTK